MAALLGHTRSPAIIWPGGRVDILYERFKECIIDQQWRPDQPLNIDRLAQEYNVSITPVREALARLSADKLVVAMPYRGYRVASPPSPARLAELGTVRLLLEPHAACGAAMHATPGDVAELRAIQDSIAPLRTSTRYADIREFAALNRAFHQRIFHLNGNQMLDELYGQMNYHVVISHVYHSHGIPDLPEVLREHNVILDAIAAADPDAAERAMHAHIERGSHRLMDVYDSFSE